MSRNAPPEKPSCIGAVVRITWSMARRRPVGSGPPMTETMPALAVTALLHERAMASARWPTRAAARRGASGAATEAGDAQDREARRRIPAGELRVERLDRRARRTCSPSSRPSARAVVSDDVVGVDQAAGRTPAALHLHDRWRGGGHGIGELIRNISEKVVRHVLHRCRSSRREHHPNGLQSGAWNR